MKALLARKIGMSQIFTDGKIQSVTILAVPENEIIGVRTKDKDGYEAIILRAKDGRREKITEFAGQGEIGKKIATDEFAPGDQIEITGIAKGKGFAGTIKRHGFSRGPKTHGSHNIRQPGSIGSAFPQRVIKGRKMPGRLGGERVTVKGLKIVDIDPEERLMLVAGSVPGPKKGWVKVIGS